MPLTRAQLRDRTRERVIAAGERLFVERGFHASSVGDIAEAAGYTKGAVYSNFAAKEDVFFAVYERRAARGIEDIERALAEHGVPEALDVISLRTARRRGTAEDGWMAAFFEFWAHVIRRPALRERFAAIHRGVQQPLVQALSASVGRDARELVVAGTRCSSGSRSST
ncbi:TetR/AcrR family transcriptional regulator [Solirubrobacter sp. CPCC 204708]|uniref:TetR/AcrR family transcriptional regulator n=1 Tax=Solirubrobacter deserti TaxID=2282478 RepID=A0ABT4RQX1_9ACTN|nr:TetR/AcrR family transcriptional regulator [Solirubrobacter deserti]MBE2320714.1 TetR/AcrR family transcriptional regulator [Solirubrobacter deserti]MDA0140939.1 TetR/AcrR family transcriptional regulator [Solirubrobacter deserti]